LIAKAIKPTDAKFLMRSESVESFMLVPDGNNVRDGLHWRLVSQSMYKESAESSQFLMNSVVRLRLRGLFQAAVHEQALAAFLYPGDE
jgi:hypothetical protein